MPGLSRRTDKGDPNTVQSFYYITVIVRGLGVSFLAVDKASETAASITSG